MNFIFDEISQKLTAGCEKGYRKGLQSIVDLNKKEILRLAENPLFTISYNKTDEILLNNFIAEAFTVAGVMNYECEEKLKALAKSIFDGTHPMLQAHPESVNIKLLWQNEAYKIISDYVEVEDMPSPVQLDTNLRTAYNSSYHAAQHQRLQDVKDIYTAYRYKTQADGRVRDEHAVLHDKVFAATDPIWDTIWPPNGWNCRCYIEPLAQDEIAGLDPKDRMPLEDSQQRDLFIKAANVSDDFKRNAGQQKSIWGKWLKEKLKDMPEQVLADIKKRIQPVR